MKSKPTILIILVVAIAGFLMWWFSTEQVLLRRTASLLDSLRIEEGSGRMERAVKADNLAGLLDDPVVITYPNMASIFKSPYATSEPISISGDKAKGAHLYVGELAKFIEVTENSIEVMEHDDTSATVKVDFKMRTLFKNSPEKSANITGTLRYSKVDSHWVLSAGEFN